MSTNISRRMYLNSNDGDSQDTLNNNKIFHVGDAEFKSDPNQTLGLAIVKAVLPSTIGSLPATNKDGDLSMVLISESAGGGGLHYRIIFNSNNLDLPDFVINMDPTQSELTTFVNKYYNITPKTTPKDIIGILNEVTGATIVTLDPESLLIGSNRIALADPTGSNVFFMLGPLSSGGVALPTDPATLRMFGCPPEGQLLYHYATNPALYQTVMKYELNPGSALSAVQVRTQFNCGSFSSCNNGVRSILGEIPVTMSNSMATNQVLSSVSNLVITDYQTDAQIIYQNMSLQGAHKNIKTDTVTNIDLTLTNADGGILNLLGQTYYLELEVISIGTF